MASPRTVVPTIYQKRLLNQSFLTSSDYRKIPSYFKMGIGTTQITESLTDLPNPVPIENGTVNDDGSNQLTGAGGGDNTTDNTTTYKDGAGTSDVTAQNLLTNTSSTNKAWDITDLSSNGTNVDKTLRGGLWLYIKDSTTMDKLITSSCLTIRVGSDTTSNYYSISFDKSDLSTGWNWITSTDAIQDWTETGTVGSPVDSLRILIITNNSTDEFSAGDVVYDLFRTWSSNDEQASIKAGYPLVNESEVYAEVQATITQSKAVGFDITTFGVFNEADEPMILAQITDAGESKDDSDIFVLRTVMNLRNRRVTTS